MTAADRRAAALAAGLVPVGDAPLRRSLFVTTVMERPRSGANTTEPWTIPEALDLDRRIEAGFRAVGAPAAGRRVRALYDAAAAVGVFPKNDRWNHPEANVRTAVDRLSHLLPSVFSHAGRCDLCGLDREPGAMLSMAMGLWRGCKPKKPGLEPLRIEDDPLHLVGFQLRRSHEGSGIVPRRDCSGRTTYWTEGWYVAAIHTILSMDGARGDGTHLPGSTVVLLQAARRLGLAGHTADCGHMALLLDRGAAL